MYGERFPENKILSKEIICIIMHKNKMALPSTEKKDLF
jgi:hypothetical protein